MIVYIPSLSIALQETSTYASDIDLNWKWCRHVDDMSITDQNVVKFSEHCNLSQHQFLEIPCKWGAPDFDPEKLASFYYYCIFEFFGTEE